MDGCSADAPAENPEEPAPSPTGAETKQSEWVKRATANGRTKTRGEKNNGGLRRREGKTEVNGEHNVASVLFELFVLFVHYHLHWVCEHHTVEADEVLVVQGVHGVDLADEILQSIRLAQHICLQALHRHVQLAGQIKRK